MRNNTFVNKILFIVFCFFSILNLSDAKAQFVPSPTPSQEVTIPKDINVDSIDGLLSRMTDAQIRGLLRNELIDRAEQNSIVEEVSETTLEKINLRLGQMLETIDKRVRRWGVALWNIESRFPKVKDRLEKTSAGIPGMFLGMVILVLTGLLAAFIVRMLTKNWHTWLIDVEGARYWDRVLRTFAFAAAELLQVAAFFIATISVAPFLEGLLGPLNGLVWIYYTGIWNGWVFLILTRRIFAPLHPQIRISSISNDAAMTIFRIIKKVVIFGVSGWTAAGLFPNLGFGFPPAIITVALTGTIIAMFLLYKIIWNLHSFRQSINNTLLRSNKSETLVKIAVVTIPFLLCIYILFAWLVWLAVWLEKGAHNLSGPIGTIFIVLLIPLFERFGRELINSIVRAESEIADRIKAALCSAWRVVIGIVAVLSIFNLWGLNIIEFAKGENATVWASTLFDITITILLGQLIWRIVSALLHTEKRTDAGSEDADPDAPGASRLETLIPVFKNILLGILAIVIILIILSALGVDIGPLIASAGIVGIAIGFGAQTLVRDIFSGIFFLIDDAFRVGEYIELEEKLMGEVETITIRSLQLRNHRGPVITIPFGELKQITNHSRDWVIYKMEFRLEPNTSPQQIKKVVKAVGAEFMAHPDHGPKFIEPLKSQGVKSIDDDSALIMRVKFKCLPRTQFVLRREIYHRIQEVFAENNIHFARRKIEVVGADGEAIEDKSKIAIPEDMLQKPAAT